MAAVSGKVGALYMQTTDVSATLTNAATTELLGDYTRYRITDSSKRYLDKGTAATVKVNGVTQSSGYTVEYAGGEVVFSPALTGVDVVTVSGKYWTMAQEGGFFNWSAELSQDMGDITTFASNGWKENLSTLKGFTVSAEAYWLDEDFMERLGEEVVIVLYVDSGSNKYRYEGFAKITSNSVEIAVDDIVQESIEFTGEGQLYYRGG